VSIKEGIGPGHARTLVKIIKDKKLKVQAAIHEDSVSVSGEKRDDLQQAIQALRQGDGIEMELQFTNFRD
jgi:cyclic-di-GMP-binding protein